MVFVQKDQETPRFERDGKRYLTRPPPPATHSPWVWPPGRSSEDAGLGCPAGELLSTAKGSLVSTLLAVGLVLRRSSKAS